MKGPGDEATWGPCIDVQDPRYDDKVEKEGECKGCTRKRCDGCPIIYG